MASRTHKRKNPALITPLEAFKAAIARRDVDGAAQWYVTLREKDDADWGAYHEDHRRHARQRSHSPESIAHDTLANLHAKLQGHPGCLYVHRMRAGERDERDAADDILTAGHGSFFRKLRGAIRALGVSLSLDIPSPKHPRIRPVKDELARHAKDDERYKTKRKIAAVYQLTKSWKTVPERTFSDKADMLREDKQSFSDFVDRNFPGVVADRVRRAYALLPGSLASGRYRSRRDAHATKGHMGPTDLLALLIQVGVPARDLAGKFWRALTRLPGARSYPRDAGSPAEYVRGLVSMPMASAQAHPEKQAAGWLRRMALDPEDPALMAALLGLPGEPSDAQCRQAVNRAEAAAEQRRATATLASAKVVDDWARLHPGNKSFRTPAGWRWLKEGEGAALCTWAAKTNACIIDRITAGSMGDFVGVLRGPKGQVVGIERDGGEMLCLNAHSCCDKNNAHDAAAWEWASKPQRMKSDAVARAERQKRIRDQREERQAAAWARRRTADGSARADLRAEARGDWALLDNPRKAGPIRVLGRLPNGAPFLWTSQR